MSKKQLQAPLHNVRIPTPEDIAAQKQARIDAQRWMFNRQFYLSLQGKSVFNSF